MIYKFCGLQKYTCNLNNINMLKLIFKAYKKPINHFFINFFSSILKF